MKKQIIYLKIAINFILFLLGVLFLIFVVPKILSFFMPFVIGWIISMIANPLVKFLERKVKILRKHSSAMIIIVVIAAIAGVLYGLAAFIIREVSQLMKDIPDIYQSMELQLREVSNRLNGIYVHLPAGLKHILGNMNINFTEFGSKLMENEKTLSISQAGTYAKNIVEVLLMAIITVLSAYFFIAERDNLVRSFKKVMPKSVIKGYGLIMDNFKTAVGGYFKAQFKIMLILILILFVGLEILKVNYSFLLAALIGFVDFLPILGTGAIIWPWALISMLLGDYLKAIILLVIYLICQIVKHVLQPKMVGDSIGISPFSTLLFMFVGYKVMGVLGMIIGIPVGMVIISFYRIGIFDRIIRGFKIIIHDINDFRKF